MRRSNMNTRTKHIRWIALAIVVCFITVTGAVAAGNTAVTGTVVKTKSGVVVIQTPDKQQYIVVGRNLSKMVGKTVKATGTLSESTNGKSIKVLKVVEVKK